VLSFGAGASRIPFLVQAPPAWLQGGRGERRPGSFEDVMPTLPSWRARPCRLGGRKSLAGSAAEKRNSRIAT
jgi:hypothetical protein